MENFKKYFKDCLNYMNISEELFYETIDSFRPDHIWTKKGKKWELKRQFGMKNRIIARLDIKSLNLIKGIHLEGLKIIGDPSEYSQKYFKDNVDEIIVIDSVATLYDRKPNLELLKKITRDIFCPITIGGGIRNLDDAISILNCGSDKIAINTAAVKNPKLITKLAKTIGSQSVVVSIQAKKREGWWELFTDNGREKRNRCYGMDKKSK